MGMSSNRIRVIIAFTHAYVFIIPDAGCRLPERKSILWYIQNIKKTTLTNTIMVTMEITYQNQNINKQGDEYNCNWCVVTKVRN